MPVHSAAPVPASLASMDSAVVMVHSQMPHLAYPHFAAASMYAAHGAPIVPGPPSMQVQTSTQHQQQPTPQQLHQQQQLPSNDISGDVISPESSAALTSQVETQDNRATASSPWAEEPQDDIPTFQQEQSRTNESNTWTNSNYRSNDQGSCGFFYWFISPSFINFPFRLNRWTSQRLSWPWERWP